jgi:multidrug transporter EmrE-like cation transporter
MMYFWLILSGLLVGLGDFLSKKWSLGEGTVWAWVSVICYALSGASWLPALRISQSLCLTGILWILGSSLVVVALGIGCFKEPITIRQMVGIVCSVFAIVLMSW